MSIDTKTLAAAKKYTKESMQGAGAIKGQKGEPGQDGFSPTIKIKIDTDTEYVLTITTKNGSYDTPNLKKTIIGTITPETIKQAVSDCLAERSINYEDMSNKPTINGVELFGNLTLNDIGITEASDNINFDNFF